MARAIVLGGPIPPKGQDGLGRPTYRSPDGTDLPARVAVAAREYRVTNSRSPRRVRLGQQELDELRHIMRIEWSSDWWDTRGLTVCGLEVVAVADEYSLLEVE